jgi:hypothetical protein
MSRSDSWVLKLWRIGLSSRPHQGTVESGYALQRWTPKPCRVFCGTRTLAQRWELYAQSDMESMRDAQGKFLELLMGDRIHLLTERVQ